MAHANWVIKGVLHQKLLQKCRQDSRKARSDETIPTVAEAGTLGASSMEELRDMLCDLRRGMQSTRDNLGGRELEASPTSHLQYLLLLPLLGTPNWKPEIKGAS